MNFSKKNYEYQKNNRYSLSTTLLKISVVCLLFLTTSCFLTGVKGDRNVVTQDRNISSDFDAIHASYGIDVKLTMGSAVSLRLEADENLHDIIITEVEDGVLRIYSEKNIYSAKKRTVYVTANEVNEIKATSGSSVISENTIKAEDFKVKTTSGANVKLIVDTQSTSCSATSGSNIRLTGKTQKLTASSTSGANVKAKDLESKVCEARATSGSVMSVFASQELDASATSGANIRCSGNPEVVRKNSSSGGSISS
jgi:hypothetical protein